MPVQLPILSADEAAKLQALAAMGTLPLVAELVAVGWPGGVRWYAAMAYDRLPLYAGISAHINYAPIEVRLPRGRRPDHFTPINENSDIADDKITLQFTDLDRGVSSLYDQHGPDYRVEIWRYYPQVNLWRRRWKGVLDAPTGRADGIFEITATVGNRSASDFFPGRIRGAPGCQAIFGGLLSSQEEIDEGRCPYNRQLPGGTTGLLDGGQPFASCPQLEKSDCAARLGDALNWVGSDIGQDGNAVAISGGSVTSGRVRGNETGSEQPFGILLGKRFVNYELPAMAIIADVNTSHPDRAARRVLAELSEGPIDGAINFYVDNKPVQYQQTNVRLGHPRQAPSPFTPDVNNYSWLAHAVVTTFGNDPNAPPESVKTRCEFTGGFNYSRVYSGPTTWTRASSDTRAWNLYAILTDKLWGRGEAHGEFDPQNFIDLAARDAEWVEFTDARGKVRQCQRSRFTHYYQGSRPSAIVLRELCLWGGYLPPQMIEGKYRVFTLDKEPDLAAVPVFFDERLEGQRPNILAEDRESYKTSVRVVNERHPRDLVYSLVVSFFDEQYNFKKRTITVADRHAQTAEGRKLGEFKFRRKAAQYEAVGVITEAEAVYRAEQILYEGEFGSGGLRNPYGVRLLVGFHEVEERRLYRGRVIRVLSDALPKLAGAQKHEYFRILTIREREDLQAEIVAQVYDHTFHARETVLPSPPVGGGSTVNPYSIPGAIPNPFTIVNPVAGDDEIAFTLGL